MTDEEPEPPAVLPESLCERVRDLSDQQLRELIDYSGALIDYHDHDHDVADEIEAGPDEELVRVEERDGYTEVVKRVPCGEDCADCPHGPYVYHVRQVADEEGGNRLLWQFIGRVR